MERGAADYTDFNPPHPRNPRLMTPNRGLPFNSVCIQTDDTRIYVSMTGIEWLIEAFGCPEPRLTDRGHSTAFFDTVVQLMKLRPVGDAVWHVFENGGGLTGIWLLQESHLAIHTFPEYRSARVNIFCCTPRRGLDWREALHETLGATDVRVREFERTYDRSGSLI